MKKACLIILVSFSFLMLSLKANSKEYVLKKETNLNTKTNSEKYFTKNQMSLVDIISFALEKNPQTRQAWLTTAISETDYKRSLAGYYPQVDLSGGYSASETDFETTGVENTSAESRSGDVSFSWLLFDFGEREADVKEFNYKLKSARFSENEAMQNLVYSVINSYYDLFSTVATEQAKREVETSSLEAFKAASLRYKLGLVPLTDKLQADTAYAKAQLARQKAENQVKIAKGNLNYLLNLSPNEALDIKMPDLTIDKNPLDRDIEYLMDIAIKKRPELRAKMEDKLSITENIKKTKRQRYPSISLTGSYTKSDDLRGTSVDYNKSNVGLTATMPLFTGGDIKNQIAKSKRELDFVDSEIRDLKKEIELDVWKAYQNFETTKVIFKTSEKLLKNAIETEETTLGMYRNGKSSILDLLKSQSDLANAKEEFIFSQYSWFIARANLVRAIGEDSFRFIEK
ncbi:TolC family protein [Pseudomonadota bacterium]